jgi:hypothetical protein
MKEFHVRLRAPQRYSFRIFYNKTRTDHPTIDEEDPVRPLSRTELISQKAPDIMVEMQYHDPRAIGEVMYWKNLFLETFCADIIRYISYRQILLLQAGLSAMKAYSHIHLFTYLLPPIHSIHTMKSKIT